MLEAWHMNHATPDWSAILRAILADFGCQTGTLHRSTPDGRTLVLVCQIGIPANLIDRISSIPYGKGIAGAAAEREQPVTLCNLQQDLEGVARPDARASGVGGSIAVPVFARGKVIGTLGIGMAAAHEFSAIERQKIEAAARKIAELLENKAACDG